MKFDPTIYKIKQTIIRYVELKKYFDSNYWSLEFVSNGSEVQGYPSILLNENVFDNGIKIMLDFLGVDNIEKAKITNIIESNQIVCYKAYTNYDVFFLFNPSNNKIFSPQIEFMTEEYRKYINEKKLTEEFKNLPDKDILLYGFILDMKSNNEETEYLKSWVYSNMLQNKLDKTLENKKQNKPVVKI